MATPSADTKGKTPVDALPSLPTKQGILTPGILYGSPIPTFVIDTNHRIIGWNKALEQLSGISAASVMGTRQQWRAFYAEKRPCMADLLVAEAFEGIERWYSGKYRKSQLIDEAYEAVDFFPALGREGRWLRFTAAAVRNADGTLAGAVETLEDITERRNAEEERIESERKLQTLIRRFPIPAFMINQNHEVIHWNRALEELSGIKEQSMLGTNRHWQAFYKAERPCLADIIVDQTPRVVERWYGPKAGKSPLIDEAYEAIDFFPDLGDAGRWLHFTAAAVRNSQGEMIGAITTLENITERKDAEQALRKAHDELEVRVQERTRALTESSRALRAEVIERRITEEKLGKREEELKIKSANLEEMNTALKVLLKQRDEDKRELEEKILANVREVLLPYIEKLKKTNLDEDQRTTMEVVETHLNDIISPFIRSLTDKYLNMTSREVQVATLVKAGKTTKEIAQLLHTSTAAVDFHRNNLRIKLGLKNKKTGLRIHLLSNL
ncbi:MAG: PAS domain S-box protein [Deltaproteobacteria bacterium]|nr:PAS domain S-box protein [Deltaproteobacteria bacterium]